MSNKGKGKGEEGRRGGEGLAGCTKNLSRKAATNYHFIRGGWDDPNCAHRTSTVLSCAFCEHWDCPSYPAPFFSILLLNTRLALQPPHILHDLIDILRSDGVDLRHVAELPMVRPDAVGRRQLECLIPVMVRLVDLMH